MNITLEIYLTRLMTSLTSDHYTLHYAAVQDNNFELAT